MKKIALLSLFVCFIALSTEAQIVNIERSRMSDDSLGIQGLVDFSYFQRKNTNTLLLFSNTTAVQYRFKRSILLGLNSFNFIDIFGSDAFPDRSFFQHLRYSYLLDSAGRYAIEAFGQTQSDRILQIGFRGLTGAGFRWEFVDNKVVTAKTGLIGMYEYEEEKNLDVTYEAIRLSYYLSCRLQPVDFLTWNATVYYQPVVDYLDDYRVSLVTGLEFKVKEWLTLGLNLNWNYDTHPSIQLFENGDPANGPLNTLYQTSNSLSIKF